jgi:hypothetical protein
MNESDVQTTEEAIRTRASRLSAEKALPQSGADTLVRIIKGYAIASSGGQTKINYKDVASAAGISPFVVSGNNKFLLEAQILSSPKYGYYIPTENAVRFAREAAWDEDTAKAHLRAILTETWFGQIVQQNFALRSQLTRTELKRAFAIKAGATEADSTALDYLIDFVIYTGLVIEDEKGALKKGETSNEAGRPAPEVALQGSIGLGTRVSPMQTEGRTGKPQLCVHIHIRELDQLTVENARRIRRWMDSFTGDGGLDVEVDLGSEESVDDHRDLALPA